MRLLNDSLAALTVAMAANSDAALLEHMVCAELVATLVAANPAVATFISGTAEVQTLTFPALAAAANGDYVEVFDASGLAWAVAIDKTGLAAATPTGAVWAAIPAGRKVYYDFSTGTTAASMAALAELAFNSLVGFSTAVTTDDTAADGTMLLTQVNPGPTTNPVPKTKNDSGAGSIAGVQTTGGVAGNVDLANDQVTVAAHGYLTGVKTALTTSVTLPTGLSATNYFMIAVDANTLAFATSQANALAGTKVNITGYGSGTHTLTPAVALAGSVKIQKNSEPDDQTAVWVDVPSSSQNFAAAGSLSFAMADIGFRSVRAVVTVTSGTVTVATRVNGKGA
jgi:hypothetical protein